MANEIRNGAKKATQMRLSVSKQRQLRPTKMAIQEHVISECAIFFPQKGRDIS
jgi:hypothetical protein